MNSNLFIIAKYSLPYVAYAALGFVIFYMFGYEFLATIFFFVTLFFLYTFRNPERELQNFDNASILSPCDGVVTAIEELEDSEYRYKVEIESSMMDVGMLRNPVSGSVASVVVQKGVKISKHSKLFSALSESLSIEYCDENKNTLKVIHQLKQSVFPIFNELNNAQNVMKSMRYGFASNCVTTIYLPKNVRLDIQIAQKLKASENLIAYFS